MAEINKNKYNTVKKNIAKPRLFNGQLTLKQKFVAAMLLVSSVAALAQTNVSEIAYNAGDNITNQIPYFDNRFRIDDELDEVTLLFYRKKGTPPVILVRPDGSKLKVNDIPKDKVQWFDDQTYDMIKIKSPMVGPWQVIGSVQPNSKIMVVSDVLLEVEPLPNIILQGETLRMKGRLFNGDVAIENPAFQDVLVLDVDFFSTNNSAYDNFGAEPVRLGAFRDDGRDLDEHANDNLFTGEFELTIAPGEWEPIYIVKLPMATRELRQKPVVVHKNPVSISVATTQDENGVHVATFSIDDSLVNADSILLQGKITYPDRQVEPFTVATGAGLSRRHDIAYTEPGVHRIKLSVFGETINGREFRATLSEYSFNVDRLVGVGTSLLANETTNLTPEQLKAQAVAKAEQEAQELAQALAQAKVAQEAALADKQQKTMFMIVGGNTLVIIVAALMFIFIRRKNRQ